MATSCNRNSLPGPRLHLTTEDTSALGWHRCRRAVAVFSFLTTILLVSLVGLDAPVYASETESEAIATAKRRAMVYEQIARRGIEDRAVLAAMREVPRHLFVPSAYAAHAYRDQPIKIGFDQTISQPYIVALMAELLRLDKSSKVLEVGTGSGYDAAVVSRIAGRVFTIEIVPELGKRARGLLERLGYDNVKVKVGDGLEGWPEEGPFDAILLTVATTEVPEKLLKQLKPGGRMVLPEGSGKVQDLLVVTRLGDAYERERVTAVRFEPVLGEVRRKR